MRDRPVCGEPKIPLAVSAVVAEEGHADDADDDDNPLAIGPKSDSFAPDTIFGTKSCSPRNGQHPRPPFPHTASSRQEFWPALISATFHHEKEHTKNTSKIKTPANLPLLAISAIFGVSVVNSGLFGEPKRVPGQYFSIFLFVRARVVNFARVVLFSLSKNGKVENARFLENQRFS